MDEFLEEFAEAWRASRMTRTIAIAIVGALVFAIVVGALAELTRPRIYLIRDAEAHDER